LQIKNHWVRQLWWFPVVVLLTGMSAVIARYFNEVLSGGEPWKSGDWLINYRGGFVRRGALGEIFLRLSESLSIKLLWVSFFFQVGSYLIAIYYVARLYLARIRPKEWSLVILSPAFLLFAFYDYLGGFRKEIIAFAAFSILADQYARSRFSRSKLFVSYFLYFIGCMSHELIALTCPFFLYITYLLRQKNVLSEPVAKASYLFFVTNAVIALWIGIHFYGDSSFVTAICYSIIEQGVSPNICLGAIDSLSIRYTDEVLSKVGHFVWFYMPVFALALTPILISDWYKNDRRSFVVLALGFFCLSPLFLVAYDWGRWIHIFIFFATVLLLAQSICMPIRFPKISAIVLVFYLALWMIPTLYASGNTTNGLFWRLVSIMNRFFS
jgi:hypothetical protein